MEVEEGGQEKPPPEGWKKPAPEGGDKPPKRKMKTPYQLEVLEKTYAVETYPSEAVRADLSVKTGLSDRQLQMWFCHRRLKDRKLPSTTRRQRREEESLPPTPPPPVLPPLNDRVSSESGGVGLSSSPYRSSGESRRAVPRAAVAVPRIGMDMSAVGRRYYEPLLPPPTHLSQPSMMDLQILASVEAQLGEPLRQDGPVLGVEFDPLPPGAFGAPIAEMPVQPKQPMRSYDANVFERHDTKTLKASSFLSSTEHFLPSSSNSKKKPVVGGSHLIHPPRALHEYQFLPEQPSGRLDPHERASQSHYYDSSVDAPIIRAASITSGGKHVHGNAEEAPSYTFQGQISSASLLSQHSRQQNFSSVAMEHDSAPHGNSFPHPATDTQFGSHQVIALENQYTPADRTLYDENLSRLDRKRKSDEARIAKEVEAHEKRIRKELEKQDILRRKREEQVQREMERHDRERRKEEERMMREKQREEERFQREQRREIERREKFLLKESRRAEKLRQKEEQRREKEAARQKAATERATARRIAREYLELIEDERLELMELAAANKGFSSIFALDSDTLQQLDLFRSMLTPFPPSTVRLPRPFAFQTWADSDENIANLLMVWKFLITFADILGLWPFTLDEFVQSLHDYDSRLLGEVHVALLKSIIKDIEDVARTPITVGVSQSNTANPGGGHPHIVEGAYAWGFNIRSWQRHLNYLTWPEILRQFALSAGFGPQLKKREVERMYYRDDNEGNNSEDIISTLRNGSAVENAVALMHERGYTHRRRNRHRLTPGTVKFAAFHVLSLEGSKGLSILEVADKIQKSGLRDLTTSKTPEASIAAALSRDTKLFERTAPSTYCVRSPYRKDPADADTVLSSAREKIRVFQNALSDSEEAEKDTEDVDDAERDEDSEGDAADDPEVDDAGSDKQGKNNPFTSELKELKDSRTLTLQPKDKGESGVNARAGLGNMEKGPHKPLENTKAAITSCASQLHDTNSNSHEVINADMEDTEIDESNLGEAWVQGLSEGDYSELSVEERLNALVSLIGVAIEGNSIRLILEERLEAASALKKQMWAEAQLDKRRFREEYSSKTQSTAYAGFKAEVAQTNGPREENQTPLDNVDGNPDGITNQQFLEPNQANLTNMSMGQEFTCTDIYPAQNFGYATEKSRSQLKSFIGHKAEQLYVYRTLPLGQDRRRNRYWQFSTSSSPNDPGSGRIFFESKDGDWRLIDSAEAFDALLAALDIRGIRESHLHSMLLRIETTFKEAIKRNTKAINSAKCIGDHAKTVLNKVTSNSDCSMELDSPSSSLCGFASDALEYSTSFNIELGRNEIEKNDILRRYQGFMRWMWKECNNSLILCALKFGKKRCSELLHTCDACLQSFLSEERHCPCCHKTFKNFYNHEAIFSEHVASCEKKRKSDPDWKLQVAESYLPIGIRLLKAQLSAIEVSIPAEALQAFWTEGYRKSWSVKLHSSSSAGELFQILTLLESAIKRDFLSSNFETTTELLSSATAGVPSDYIAANSGPVPVLPWVPDTLAAVSLRLLDLDSSISYLLHQKMESHRENEGDYIKLPSRFSVVNNIQEMELMGTPEQVDYQNEGLWLDSGSGRRGRGRGSRGRGGRGRGRGGRGLRASGSSSRAELRAENLSSFEKPTRKYTRRGRTRGRGSRRGRRTARPRQRSENRPSTIDKSALLGSFMTPSSAMHARVESPESSGGEEWAIGESGKTYIEDDDNSAGFESDENGQASAEDYDNQAAYSFRDDYDEGKPIGLVEDETDEDDGGDMEGDEEGEDDMDRDVNGLDTYIDDEDEDDEIGDNAEDVGDAEGNGDEDDGASSFSSEYSD